MDSCAGMSLGLKSWHLGIAQRYPQIGQQGPSLVKSQNDVPPVNNNYLSAFASYPVMGYRTWLLLFTNK